MTIKVLEWFGVITAIFYSILVASNTGNEVFGFAYYLYQQLQLDYGLSYAGITGC